MLSVTMTISHVIIVRYDLFVIIYEFNIVRMLCMGTERKLSFVKRYLESGVKMKYIKVRIIPEINRRSLL